MPTYDIITDNGSKGRLIHVHTPNGPYPVDVRNRSQVPVYGTNEAGEQVITGLDTLTWDQTCEQIAEQVRANLAAAES